jgi:hypothetical protein
MMGDWRRGTADDDSSFEDATGAMSASATDEVDKDDDDIDVECWGEENAFAAAASSSNGGARGKHVASVA